MKWDLAHGKPHSSNCGTLGIKLGYTKSVSSEIRMQLGGLQLKSPELSMHGTQTEISVRCPD